MNYTIMYSVDMASSQELSLNKKGNSYNVLLANANNGTSVTFTSIDKALEKYNKLVECFAKGLYSYEDRVKILIKEI